MPWSFRKTKKIALGVRVNLGKKSASVSVGNKFVGVTKNTKGQTTKRVSIPGTGISYRKTKNKKK